MKLAGGSQPAHPQEPQPGYDGGLWKKPSQSERKSRRTEEGQLELTAMQQKREKAKEGRLQNHPQRAMREQTQSHEAGRLVPHWRPDLESRRHPASSNLKEGSSKLGGQVLPFQKW